MSRKKLRVCIADDHHLVRRGLVSVVEGFERVGSVVEASNGIELIKLLEQELVDVILLDIEMPLLDGRQASKEITRRFPDVKIIVLSAYDEDSVIIDFFEIGVHAYLLKSVKAVELDKAICSVVDKDFYQNEITMRVFRRRIRKAIRPEGPELSEREIQVLKLMLAEKTSGEIAEQLNISEKTVHGHRQKLLEKTGAKGNIGLVFFAIDRGIIKLKN